MNWFVVDKFLMEALKEDNLYGDITTEAIVDKSSICSVELIVKEDGIIAGVNIFERVALNMFEKISGIVTITNRFVKEIKETKAKLLDTRKTTPNLRVFEKYAVKVGGGYNHRFSLSDGVLIKDNHIDAAGGIKKAIELVRNNTSFVRKIEVEVEDYSPIT